MRKIMSVTLTTRLIDRKEDSTEDWFKKSFWNILAQDYIIWMSCTMLVVKHAYLCQCNQGIMTKYSNSECKCLIPMTMMHSWNRWLQCRYNAMIGCSMRKIKWCIWHALAIMSTQWCIHHDAKWQCSWVMLAMRCMSMMHTHMSWGCTWFTPRNRPRETTTWLVYILERGSNVRTLVRLHKRGLQWVTSHIPRHQCAPSGSIMWLQRT